MWHTMFVNNRQEHAVNNNCHKRFGIDHTQLSESVGSQKVDCN